MEQAMQVENEVFAVLRLGGRNGGTDGVPREAKAGLHEVEGGGDGRIAPAGVGVRTIAVGGRCVVGVCLRDAAPERGQLGQGDNMTKLKSSESASASGERAAPGRLFVLDLSGNRVLSVNPDGSDRKVIVHECRMPDGIAVDVKRGHIYWTNMGVLHLNDGSIERADLDGRNRRTIVPQGGTFTPKQLQLDGRNGKLYWCDREGMRVMRSNLNGSAVETLVETGRGDADRRDQTRWCVGIAVDAAREHIYWTQKGPDNAELGRIFRANIELPAGQTASNRTDI